MENTTKVVYNKCFGGFGLSKEQHARYKELAGKEYDDFDGSRTDPYLVQVVEEKNIPKTFSELSIRELPKGTVYRIHEYDGYESVMTFDEHEWAIA